MKIGQANSMMMKIYHVGPSMLSAMSTTDIGVDGSTSRSQAKIESNLGREGSSTLMMSAMSGTDMSVDGSTSRSQAKIGSES